MKQVHVYLGRFSPFHCGHEGMIQKMISLYGVENILIMIGSSNTYNDRTPYTYVERERMIHSIFPEIEILALPDGRPDLVYFDGSTNGIWLDSIDKIAKDRNEYFSFVGGCKEDLEILSERFDTEILIERNETVDKISASKVRSALRENNQELLRQMINPNILDQVIEGWKNFINSQGQ